MEKISEKKLTNRELEVLELMAKGVSNSYIARKLFVTDATVKAHISHIFEKLEVKNRVQAVVLAIKKKLFK